MFQDDRSDREPSHLPDSKRHALLLAVTESYHHALLRGDRAQAQALVLQGLSDGLTLADLYIDVFQPVLYTVGKMWEAGEISVTQEHLATAITQTALAKIYGLALLPTGTEKRAIIACLSGNLHEIGARMIADFLQLAGYDARFMGANTAEEVFLAAVDEDRPEIVGLSASLDVHIARITETIHILRNDFGSYHPIIMVGGGAFNRDEALWKQVGADIWGADARQAIANLESNLS